MGLVKVIGQIGGSREHLFDVEFLVDTGGFYSAVSSPLREQLELPAGVWGQTQLADRSIVDVEVTVAHLQLNGRHGVVPVEIIDAPEPLLGASALEALGMKVNPISGQLEVVSPFQAPPTVTRFFPFNP